VYTVKHVSKKNSTIQKTLLVFCYRGPSTSLQKLYMNCTSAYSSNVNVKGISATLLYNEKQLHQLNTTIRLRKQLHQLNTTITLRTRALH
jgi:hypothetical protein